MGQAKKDGILELTEQLEVVFKEIETSVKEPKELAPASCPKCKNGTILKGATAYGCSSWKAGCNFRLPFEFMGKLLTDAQVQALAKKGETPLIKGLIKDNVKINAKLKLNTAYELMVMQ